MHSDPPKIKPLGESAVVVEFGSEISEEINAKAIALADYLDRDPFPAYRVSLQTADGDELWNLGLLKPMMTGDGKAVKFNLPSNRLDQRDYVLLLQGKSGGSKFENVSAYPFRVKRPQ